VNIQKNDVQIRRMKSADVPHVMAIAASLPEAPHWQESAYLKALNPAATPRRIALALTVADHVLGFAVASLLPPQSELETIAVAPQWHRRGLGRRLFRNLLLELGKAGVSEIALEVRASNRAAIAFYAAAGFSRQGIRRSYYADPQEDAVLMSLAIR
jgi:ribosomal-protein-alanine N-acetyltransferase